MGNTGLLTVNVSLLVVVMLIGIVGTRNETWNNSARHWFAKPTKWGWVRCCDCSTMDSNSITSIA